MLRITDSADRANPTGARLPEWSDGTRQPAPAAPLDLRVVAVIAACAALPCGVLLWVAVPALTAWRNLMLETMAIHRETLHTVILATMLLLLAGSIGGVWSWWSARGAQGRVIRGPNDMPLDVGALRRPEWGALIENSLIAHYGVQGRWADASGLRGATYAPHFSNRQQLEAIEGQPAPLALPPPLDMAALGHKPRPDAVLLGVDSSGPIVVPAPALWHVATAGPTGNGKSNFHRLMMGQLLAMGARVAVGDPKWTSYDAQQDEDWRPIERRLAMAPAVTAPQIAELLSWGAEELDRRMHERRKGQKAGAPQFIVLDELPWIYEHVKGSDRAVGELVRLGRGVGLFVMAAARDFLVKTTGLSGARDNFRTCAYLGGDLKTGSVLLDIPQRDLAALENQLGVGLAVLRSAATSPPRIVRIPYMSNAALYSMLGDAPADSGVGLGALRASQAAAAADGAQPFGFRPPQPSATDQSGFSQAAASDYSAAGSGAQPTAEEERILSLFLAGKDAGAIVTELYQMSSKAGAPYLRKLAEVQEIIRRAFARSSGGVK